MKYVNKIFLKDNLELLKTLPEKTIDFCYIDPPFFTQRKIDSSERKINHRSFYHKLQHKKIGVIDDRFKDIDDFLDFLFARIVLIKKSLTKKGIFCLHLDYRAVHYAKIELDKIFGYGNLINEVIWYYPNKVALFNSKVRKKFLKKHDTILIYSTGRDYTFNKASEKFLSRFKVQEFLPSVWDINYVTGNARLNYFTQKPEELLRRLVKTFTNEGDVVADFFCGSGTTLAVAAKLGRKYLGVDNCRDAYELSSDRLRAITTA